MSWSQRVFTLLAILVIATGAWWALGGVTLVRGTDAMQSLRGEVDTLWGRPLEVRAPQALFLTQRTERRVASVDDGQGGTRSEDHDEVVTVENAVPVATTTVAVRIDEDVRRKGLTWFPLYAATFEGTWTWEVPEGAEGPLHLRWQFPDPEGDYDAFEVVVNGQPRSEGLNPVAGTIAITLPCRPGDTMTLQLRFRLRGQEVFRYRAHDGVSELRDFVLTIDTDVLGYDLPEDALSPGSVATDGGRAALTWHFDRMVTGKAVGLVVPTPVQPGELAAALSFSAPISLAFYLVWITAVGALRDVHLSALALALVSASFFAFHLTFAYTADRLPAEVSFAIASAVSLALAIPYLARIAGWRFALGPAGLAQWVYLVGFSAAHFAEGWTGLTLTAISVLTLGAIMHLTASLERSSPLQILDP
jgi:hypothetical protein